MSIRKEWGVGDKSVKINTNSTLSLLDMDECSFSEFLCQHECVNQPGSYFCSCPPGYVLLDDNRSCQGKTVQRDQKGLTQMVICLSHPAGSCNFRKMSELDMVDLTAMGRMPEGLASSFPQ